MAAKLQSMESLAVLLQKINYLEWLLTMKTMKFKTGSKAVFFLDFMIRMLFMVKSFFTLKVDCLCCTQGFAAVLCHGGEV